MEVWEKKRVALSDDNLQFFHSIPTPLLCVTQKNHKIAAFNKAFEDEFGHISEISGKPLKQFFKPDDSLIDKNSNEGAFLFTPNSKTRYTVKLRYQNHSFENEPIELISVLKLNESKKEKPEPKQFTFYLPDIPATCGVALFDSDFKIKNVNSICLDFWGVKNKYELLKKPLGSLFHQTNRFPVILKKLKKRGVWEGQLVAKKRDGSCFYLNVMIQKIPDSANLPYAWSAAFIDVTKHTQTDAELRKTRARLDNILAAAPNSIIIVDKHGNINFCNHVTETLFGYSSNELHGKNIETLVPKRFRKDHRYHIKSYFSNPEMRPMGKELQLYGLKKDGTELPVDISLGPYREDGEKKVVVIIHDISSHKKNEQLIQREKNFIKLLHKLSIIDNGTESIEDILEKSVEVCCHFLSWPVGHSYLKANDGSDKFYPSGLWYIADNNKFSAFRSITLQTRFKPGEGMIGKVIQTARPQWLRNCQEDPNFVRRFNDLELGVRACIGIPVILKGEVVCVLEFFSDQILSSDEQLMEKMSTIGYQIGLVIDRMHSKNELLKSRQKLKTIFDSSNDAILLTDGMNIMDFNEKAEELLNLSHFNTGKKSIVNVLLHHSKKPENVNGQLKKYLKKAHLNEILNLEWLIHPKNKKAFHAEIDLIPIILKEKKHLLVNLRDISKRKKTEKLIRKNVKLFRKLFNNSPVGIVMLDRDGKVININKSFTESFGYSLKDIKGKFLDDFFIPEDQKRNAKIYTQKALKGESFRIEAERYHKNGSLRSVVVGGGSVVLDNEVHAIFGVYLDISGRKWAETEIIKLNEELEEKIEKRTKELTLANEELTAFSYSLSHDLRAPLRRIDGFSQILFEDYNQSIGDQGKQYIARIRKATQKMSLLIDEVISLAKVSRTSLKITRVNLSDLAKSIINNLQSVDPSRNVEIHIQPDMITDADPTLMEIVLQNLFENSWKYTAKNIEAKIEFGTTDSSGLKGYYIRDNGVGFDEKYEKELFTPFRRLHSESEFEGTGIGLATVKRIIHRHNGIITAKGKVNQGATFYFTLNHE